MIHVRNIQSAYDPLRSLTGDDTLIRPLHKQSQVPNFEKQLSKNASEAVIQKKHALSKVVKDMILKNQAS